MNKRQLTGILISVVFLYFAFRNINFSEFLTSLTHANYIWILPSIGSTLVSFWLRGLRWKLILDPVKRVPVKETYIATMIGYMANNVLPFRLGEILRIVALAKRTGVPKASGLASLFIERLLDMSTAVIVLGVVVFFFQDLPDWTKGVGYVIIGVVFMISVFLVLMYLRIDSMILLFRRLLKPFSEKYSLKAESIIRSFSEGLSVVEERGKSILILFVSALLWISYIGSVWFVFRAFDLNLGVLASFVVLIFVTFAFAIPSAPGFVGTFHGFTIAALTLFSVELDAARAFSVVLHAAGYITVTIIGFYYLWRSKMHFSDIKNNKTLGNSKITT